MKLAELLEPLTFIHPTNASLAASFLDRPVTGISSDSRTIQPGRVFVALVGSHTDGHQYIRQAVDAGALAVVVQMEVRPQQGP